MSSLVGQSEERTRQALKIIDAMAPCVAMIDEVEKAFAGVNGSGDSGVASRMFGTFLSWLNDHTRKLYFIAMKWKDGQWDADWSAMGMEPPPPKPSP